MSDSCRRYIYGKTHTGVAEFLVTVLSNEEAARYCVKHNKVFHYRFDHYMYGKMSEELDKWTIWRKD